MGVLRHVECEPALNCLGLYPGQHSQSCGILSFRHSFHVAPTHSIIVGPCSWALYNRSVAFLESGLHTRCTQHHQCSSICWHRTVSIFRSLDQDEREDLEERVEGKRPPSWLEENWLTVLSSSLLSVTGVASAGAGLLWYRSNAEDGLTCPRSGQSMVVASSSRSSHEPPAPPDFHSSDAEQEEAANVGGWTMGLSRMFGQTGVGSWERAEAGSQDNGPQAATSVDGEARQAGLRNNLEQFEIGTNSDRSQDSARARPESTTSTSRRQRRQERRHRGQRDATHRQLAATAARETFAAEEAEAEAGDEDEGIWWPFGE